MRSSISSSHKVCGGGTQIGRITFLMGMCTGGKLENLPEGRDNTQEKSCTCLTNDCQ